VISDFEMAKDASTAANLAMIANDCTPSNAYTGRYRAAITDLHVVRDLNLIVELATLTNHGVINRSAVNCGVRTNLAIITNANGTCLRNLDPLAAIACEPKSIRTDDCTRMDNDARSNHASRINCDSRIEATLFADRGTFTHDATCTNPGALTESSPGADHSACLDGDPCGNVGVG